MLVLTRKLNERIVVGDNVRITVVGIRGNHVRLGIEAPTTVTILRDELKRHAPAKPLETVPNVTEIEVEVVQSGLDFASAAGVGR